VSTALTSVQVCAPHEQTEGSHSQILRWLKAVGDTVQQNEPLIEVETDKVTVEIASPATGVLREIVRQEQDEIAPGETLAHIDVAAAGDALTTGGSTDASHTVVKAAAAAEIDHARARVRSRSSNGVSPAVKRLLDERGLSAQDVRGSGHGGRLTVDDVLRADPVSMPQTPDTVSDGIAGHSATSHSVASHRVPHSATRRRIAERMVQSLLHTAPHVTTVFEADFGAILAHRARHRSHFESQGVSLTLTAYILLACVDAIRAVPEVNARWHEDSLEVFDEISIGVGTAVEGKGLIVPVVRAVQTLDLLGIARQLSRLVSMAREDRLSPEAVRAGTFTVSNHGVSGSLVATPIVINQPQVAILGVGKLEKRAVVLEQAGEDRIVIRPRCYISLTIDHRALDGDRANRFLQVLVARLEAWPAHS
jgi:2-oxoglutarate dehydrogenase E2 component (dihydrolipoamide succinyltransferase)